MELKLKDSADLKLLTTQHEVIIETIGLLDTNIVHTISEIKLELMIACTNVLTDGAVLELIKEQKGMELFNTIKDVIEPFYFKNIYIKNIEEIKYLEDTLIKYYESYNNYATSLGGILETVLNYLMSLSDEDKKVLQDFSNNLTIAKTESSEQKRDYVNKKMEDLINKYMNKGN